MELMETELRREIERLRRENAALKSPSSARTITLRVSEKGAVSLYGLQRFPVTLYRNQWELLFSVAEDVRRFILDHATELKDKDKAAQA